MRKNDVAPWLTVSGVPVLSIGVTDVICAGPALTWKPAQHRTVLPPFDNGVTSSTLRGPTGVLGSMVTVTVASVGLSTFQDPDTTLTPCPKIGIVEARKFVRSLPVTVIGIGALPCRPEDGEIVNPGCGIGSGHTWKSMVSCSVPVFTKASRQPLCAIRGIVMPCETVWETP